MTLRKVKEALGGEMDGRQDRGQEPHRRRPGHDADDQEVNQHASDEDGPRLHDVERQQGLAGDISQGV
jgi:hypothetical protein